MYMFPSPFRFVGTVADLRKRLPFWRAIGAGQEQAISHGHCKCNDCHNQTLLVASYCVRCDNKARKCKCPFDDTRYFRNRHGQLIKKRDGGIFDRFPN